MLPVSVDADQTLSCPVMWRPWDVSAQSDKVFSRRVRRCSGGFHHPVRLLLPRSRMQEYLSHLGRTVLDSFPVQATLQFYNDDDSSSEDESATE